jgi:hypothetical protein
MLLREGGLQAALLSASGDIQGCWESSSGFV